MLQKLFLIRKIKGNKSTNIQLYHKPRKTTISIFYFFNLAWIKDARCFTFIFIKTVLELICIFV